MRRAFFIAMGISAVIVGLESLAVEEIEWRGEKHGKAASYLSQPSRKYEPPEWFPWACTSSGIVVVIYSTRKKH